MMVAQKVGVPEEDVAANQRRYSLGHLPSRILCNKVRDAAMD
jgi:hypothetical protein